MIALLRRRGFDIESPAPTKGFRSCAGTVIFYAFNDNYGPPQPRVEYTFTTSFAFPNAKPAAKPEYGRGWD